jgi:DNA modification methylase
MIVAGNALALPFAANTVQCCVTSPPYWGLRDYGVLGQLGIETTIGAYVSSMVAVFREVRRVLRDDGVLFLNLGDSFARDSGKGEKFRNGKNHRWSGQNPNGMTGPDVPSGLKPKDLVGIPWRVAFALQADGWWLRSDIIWAKPNPMPESVTDRPTKSHEYVFLLTKAAQYFYDKDAICEPYQDATLKRGKSIRQVSADGHKTYRFNGEPLDPDSIKRGRNARSVWTIATQPYRDAHFAVMPEKLVEPCVLAGSRPGDLVLDPFTGSGTVGVVCQRFARRFVGVELNPAYIDMARRRLKGQLGMPMEASA